MTTRRNFLTLVGAGAALGVVGCTHDAPRAALVTPPDGLLVEAAQGLTVLRDGRVMPFGVAIVAPNGRTLYSAVAADRDTDLHAISTWSGDTVATTRLIGSWEPRIASGDGRRVALTPPGAEGTGYLPSGRDHTSMLITGTLPAPTRVDILGNYVPDAFASDGSALFVLDWLPPMTPDRYRVRALDLATKTAAPLWTRAKTPIPPGGEEEMRGEGRHAVYRFDHEVLYTLYTHQPDHQHTRDLIAGTRSNVHAFVHTLNLAERWAYCVDLPAPFGEGPPEAHTITITPDGRHVFVADVSTGKMAVINTESLTVDTMVTIPQHAGTAYAAASNGRIFVGAGTEVAVIGWGDSATRASWPVSLPISGLGTSVDSRRLYVSAPGVVRWLDILTGNTGGELAAPGLTRLIRTL